MKLMVCGATTTIEHFLEDPSVRPHLGAMVTPNSGNNIDRICDWKINYCADNGCFDATRFSDTRFLSMCGRLAAAPVRPVFVTGPDKVGDHEETLCLFWDWLPRLEEFRLPLAFVAQDGMGPDLDDLPWDHIDALFVGGSDYFKDEVTLYLAQACQERGRWCHVGRVNGRRRLRLALHNGCDSVDGSSLSRFPRTWIPKFVADTLDLESEAVQLDRCIQTLWPVSANQPRYCQ